MGKLAKRTSHLRPTRQMAMHALRCISLPKKWPVCLGSSVPAVREHPSSVTWQRASLLTAAAKPERIQAAEESKPDLTELVETSMLAAISGLMFLITATLGVDRGFLFSYMLPFPIIIAGLRNGRQAAWATLWVSTSLLLVLLGPLRALTYLLNHGLSAACLSACWASALPWACSIPLMAATKSLCQVLSLGLASLSLGENVLAIAISSIGTALDKAGWLVGSSAGSGMTYNFLFGALLCFLILNSLLVTCLTHLVYYITLKAMQYDVPEAPQFVRKFVLPSA